MIRRNSWSLNVNKYTHNNNTTNKNNNRNEHAMDRSRDNRKPSNRQGDHIKDRNDRHARQRHNDAEMQSIRQYSQQQQQQMHSDPSYATTKPPQLSVEGSDGYHDSYYDSRDKHRMEVCVSQTETITRTQTRTMPDESNHSSFCNHNRPSFAGRFRLGSQQRHNDKSSHPHRRYVFFGNVVARLFFCLCFFCLIDICVFLMSIVLSLSNKIPI